MSGTLILAADSIVGATGSKGPSFTNGLLLPTTEKDREGRAPIFNRQQNNQSSTELEFRVVNGGLQWRVSNGTWKAAGPAIGDLWHGIVSNPSNVILFDGTAKLKAGIFANLWAWILVNASDVLDITGSNKAKFGMVNDSPDIFLMPDWRGLFMRTAGKNGAFSTANGKPFDGGFLLDQINDQFQGHFHSTNAAFFTNGGGVYATTSGNTDSAASVTAATTDGTNGTPRTGSETRPASVSVNVGIYYQ